jgi:hypothetical protein
MMKPTSALPKHVGVIHKQCIEFINVFVGFFTKLVLMHGMEYIKLISFVLQVKNPFCVCMFYKIYLSNFVGICITQRLEILVKRYEIMQQ